MPSTVIQQNPGSFVLVASILADFLLTTAALFELSLC